MTVTIARGDARALPLADTSVDLIVTSPPYFGLRSYQDGGEHYVGQLGDEATPAEFVDALIACTAEWMRVLKPSGSMWVNLGDKYASGDGSGNQSTLAGGVPATRKAGHSRIRRAHGVPTKSLIGIPWRYALRCIDDLGLILRSEVIWSKPNGLPESVTDRVRRSHEQWFHFTLEPRYFSAVDEIREAHLSAGDPRWLRATNPSNPDRNDGGAAMWRDGKGPNPLGKLPGSVWTVPTEPLRVPQSLGIDHFAAFPSEWPRRIIQGWSPGGVCIECGEGRRPVVEKDLDVDHAMPGQTDYRRRANTQSGGKHWDVVGSTVATITGYVCACVTQLDRMVRNVGKPSPLPPTRPAVVLDPFGGTGTTALVAHALGRHGISNDMSADYCRLAAWRTTDPGQIAKAMGVDKPPVEVIGQDYLDFGGEAS